jgi:hypothetical protein
MFPTKKKRGEKEKEQNKKMHATHLLVRTPSASTRRCNR